jgi:hypothetical protein
MGICVQMSSSTNNNKRKADTLTNSASSSPSSSSSSSLPSKRARVDEKNPPLSEESKKKAKEEKAEHVSLRVVGIDSMTCCYLCNNNNLPISNNLRVAARWPIVGGTELHLCPLCRANPRTQELAIWHFMDAHSDIRVNPTDNANRIGCVRVCTNWDQQTIFVVRSQSNKILEAKLTVLDVDANKKHSEVPRFMSMDKTTATPKLHVTFVDEKQKLGKWLTVTAIRDKNPLLPPFRYRFLHNLTLFEVLQRAPFQSWQSAASLVPSFAASATYYDERVESKPASSDSSSSSSSSATQEYMDSEATQPTPFIESSQSMDLQLYDQGDDSND